MSRLTLRLPESLHIQLKEAAKREGVSLNQFVVYALAQKTAPSFTVFKHSDESVREQVESFHAYLGNTPKASEAEVEAFLEAREGGEADMDSTNIRGFHKLHEKKSG